MKASLNVVHKTFIASSITGREPPNASLAVTHKPYCSISHASHNKLATVFELSSRLVTAAVCVHMALACWPTILMFKQGLGSHLQSAAAQLSTDREKLQGERETQQRPSYLSTG